MNEATQGRRAFLASLGASTVGLAPNRTETSLVVAQSNLRIEPIAHLEQDRVQWPRIKQILNVAAGRETPRIEFVRRASLLPDQKECAGRTVFPPKDRVGVELLDIEAWRRRGAGARVEGGLRAPGALPMESA